jgi:hypothetical protein
MPLDSEPQQRSDATDVRQQFRILDEADTRTRFVRMDHEVISKLMLVGLRQQPRSRSCRDPAAPAPYRR